MTRATFSPPVSSSITCTTSTPISHRKVRNRRIRRTSNPRTSPASKISITSQAANCSKPDLPSINTISVSLLTGPFPTRHPTPRSETIFSERAHDRHSLARLRNLYLSPHYRHGRHDFKVGSISTASTYDAQFNRQPISFLTSPKLPARNPPTSVSLRHRTKTFPCTRYSTFTSPCLTSKPMRRSPPTSKIAGVSPTVCSLNLGFASIGTRAVHEGAWFATSRRNLCSRQFRQHQTLGRNRPRL